MVRVDWNIFKAKFGDGSRQAFEDLSYSVFCREYGLKTGVFRYRNHPALETEPIRRNGENIGFQAKFFEGGLSCYKREILNAIYGVLDKYPSLNRLVFYLPTDFDCYSQGVGPSLVTKLQRDIENEAKEKDLTIEWFCLSRLEAIFARDEYEALGKYFFANEPSVYALVDGLDAKTNLTLGTIRTSSSGSGVSFHANRTSFIEKLEKELPNHICVIHGDGGVGKSGLVKEFSEQFDERIMLRPTEVSETFGAIHMKSEWHTDIVSFLKVYDCDSQKLFVLDSAEKLETEDNAAAILHVLKQFKEFGWGVLLTTRSHYRQFLETLLSLHLSAPYVFSELLPITECELSVFAKNNKVILPEDHLTKDLLRYPFYLDAFLKTCIGDSHLGLSKFKQKLWRHIIGGGVSGDIASQKFIEMVQKRIKTNNYWVDVNNANDDSVKALVTRGVLSLEESNQRYSVAHDIYEEWALERGIERLYTEQATESFFKTIVEARPMIRAYRLWLIDKLMSGEDLSELVENALSQNNKCWFDETIIAVMSSPYASFFLKQHRECLLQNNADLLCRIVRCVMLACRTSNDQMIPIKGIKYENLFRHYFTKPIGPGWKALIDFLYANKDMLHGFDLKDVIALLHDWCNAEPRGETTRKAGLLAFDFCVNHGTHKEKGFEVHHGDLGKLISAITAASWEIKEELEKILCFYLDHFSNNIDGICQDIAFAVLGKPLEHIRFVNVFPDLIYRMAKQLWLSKEHRGSIFDIGEMEGCYGLTSHYAFKYFPASAFMTPTYWLLESNPKKAVDFIVEITNTSIEHAAMANNYIGLPQTAFSFPGGMEVRQYISDALWSCHRGSIGPVIPYLLQSIHMALEKFLLETHKMHPDWAPKLETLMLDAIRDSQSASIAGVATSLVLAHPDEYFNLASVILTSRAAISADYRRCKMGEPQCQQLYEMSGSRNIYVNERLETLKEGFRNTSLENVMVHYQLLSQKDRAKRKERIEFLLDNYSKLTEDEDRFFVFRVDARKRQLFRTTDENGQPVLGFIPELPQDLLEKQRTAQDELRPNQIGMNLMLWASAKIKSKAIPSCCAQYEADLSMAIGDFKFVVDALREDTNNVFRSLIVYPAVAFLKYYYRNIDGDTINICKDIIFAFSSLGLKDSYMFQVEDGYSISISALPDIITNGNQVERTHASCLLLVAMLNENPITENQRICDLIFEIIRCHDSKGGDFGVAFIGSYITLRGMFQNYVHRNKKDLIGCRNPIGRFWREEESDILSTIFGHAVPINEALADPYQFLGVINSVLLVGNNPESVSSNIDLIIGTIQLALSFFYHLDTKERGLSSE